MIIRLKKQIQWGALMLGLLGPGLLWLAFPAMVLANIDKTKVVYHVDSKDPNVAKYALALINKHIEAEGGPDKIDIVLVVHGPALKLFEAETVDPDLKDKLKVVVDKGARAEMCQVSMKLFGTPLEKLVGGFKPTEHPVAVKRIADLQKQGYLYIKP
ncbi:MAG: DsrE family protein [Nitrospirales bacterium]|nr:DsrE family protein [Nitrospirales bacterium]